VKEFLHASIKLLDSVLQSDISNAFMNNTCTILHCDRSSLFLYDKTTDCLIASYAEGLKQNSIKVPKNKGVVGYVFTTGEKVKIDDAYKDPRFNKEIDIKTNYKTKNILCYPLKNKDGKIFGAIQAINKHNGAFDIDDLALMDFFSEQASALLQNRFNINEHTTMLSQMKILCQFSNDIMGIKDKVKFTKKSEECLQSLFYSSLNKIMLTNNLTKELEYYFEDSHSLDSRDNKHIVDLLGIIGYVWKRKEIYGCLAVKTNKYYNKLVDLNSSDVLITVPIMNEYNEIIAMVQIVSPSKVNDKTGKLIHTDMIILELFEKCVLSWYNANYCK
jgi:adenylate cyclase